MTITPQHSCQISATIGQSNATSGPLVSSSAAASSSADKAEDTSTRMRILLAAGPIFASKGFKQATVREICDAASVNVASVKYYFGDKQSLYRDSVLLARQMRADEFPNPTWEHPPEPEERLRQMVAIILHRTVVGEEASWQDQLLMNEIQNPTETCEQLASEFFRPFMTNLIEVINEIAGRVLPPMMASQMALSIVGQCMIYRFAPQARTMTLGNVLTDPSKNDCKVDLESLAELITHFSLGGIASSQDALTGATD